MKKSNAAEVIVDSLLMKVLSATQTSVFMLSQDPNECSGSWQRSGWGGKLFRKRENLRMSIEGSTTPRSRETRRSRNGPNAAFLCDLILPRSLVSQMAWGGSRSRWTAVTMMRPRAVVRQRITASSVRSLTSALFRMWRAGARRRPPGGSCLTSQPGWESLTPAQAFHSPLNDKAEFKGFVFV